MFIDSIFFIFKKIIPLKSIRTWWLLFYRFFGGGAWLILKENIFVLYRDIPLLRPPLHLVMWNTVNLRQITLDWLIVSQACVVLSVMTCQRKTLYSLLWRLIMMSVAPSISTSSLLLKYSLCLRTNYLWLDYSV